MNTIDHIFTIIAGIGIFYFADEIAGLTRYLPVFRHARDGQNPISFKIIGILVAFYGIGTLLLTLIPRA